MQTLRPYQNKLPQVGLAILLGFVLVVEMTVSILCASRHIQQSAILSALYTISVSIILSLWVHHDSLARKTSLGIDQAMYIVLAWPIMFPYYVFRTRGLRSGGLLLLLFVGIFMVAFLAAILLSIRINVAMAVFSTGW